jgi:hypothetical protein
MKLCKVIVVMSIMGFFVNFFNQCKEGFLKQNPDNDVAEVIYFEF